MRVLIVDDNAELRDLVTRALERDEHQVASVGNIASALAQLHAEHYEAVIVDLGLPDGNGIELCRAIRANGVSTPILVLTAKSQVSVRVEVLDAGADDFLAKPFAIAELRARLRAIGRRSARSLWQRGDVALDFASKQARCAGVEVALTLREWSVLHHLLRNDRRISTRTAILNEIWRDASDAASASLDVIIGRIRKKLGERIIRTVRGEGYVLGE